MSIRTRFNPLGTIGRKGLLPAGYIELEYLESVGARQYIDTGVVPQAGYTIEADAMFVNPVSLSTVYWGRETNAAGIAYPTFGLLSANTPSGNMSIRVYHSAPGSSREGIYDVNIQSGQRFSFEAKAGEFYVNGTKTAMTQPSSYTPVTTIGLFWLHQDGSWFQGSEPAATSSVRVYSFKVKDNTGRMKQRLIPALDPTGRPCMFDTVTQQPLYNEGTGEFKFGYKLPRGYTSVSAIYAPGNYTSGVMRPDESYPQFTHYIDTGYSPTNLTRVEVNATYVTIGNMGCSTFDGNAWSQGKKRFHIGPSNNRWSYGLFDSNVIYGGTFISDTNYNITLDAKNSKFVINGTQLQVAHTSNDMAGIASFCLFVRKDLDGTFEYAHDMYLYSCKIYEDDKLVRIYAPVHRDSDGVNGLYELKTRTFIFNARGAANFAELQ